MQVAKLVEQCPITEIEIMQQIRACLAAIAAISTAIAASNSSCFAQDSIATPAVEPLLIPEPAEVSRTGVQSSTVLPPVVPEPAVPPSVPEEEPHNDFEENDGETLLRGPVHEAYAEQVNADPVAGLVISKSPPEPIEEVPPEVRPDGRMVEWIAGYWAWDEDRDDFMWVSGIWRDVPQGFRWLPGYWAEVDGGYQWVSGTWVSRETTEIEYIETAPPASLEQGPTGPSPTVEHIWIPGCWSWQETRYAWRPGYWSAGYTDWIWVPARYHWTPRGFYYCNGYWDYPLARRGVLFAPRYFHRNAGLGRSRRFTPQIVVASSVLQVHLWVRPRYRHYYFGDYYGAPYASRGLLPWHQFHRQQRGSDPLFVHYSRGRGANSYFNQLDAQFNVFLRDPERRPAQTFHDQIRWARSHRTETTPQGVLLGDRLQNVVSRSGQTLGEMRFVKVEAIQRKRLETEASLTRELAVQRRVTENVRWSGREVQGNGSRSDIPRKTSETGQRDGRDLGRSKSSDAMVQKSRTANDADRDEQVEQRPMRLKLPRLDSEPAKLPQGSRGDSRTGTKMTAESRRAAESSTQGGSANTINSVRQNSGEGRPASRSTSGGENNTSGRIDSFRRDGVSASDRFGRKEGSSPSQANRQVKTKTEDQGSPAISPIDSKNIQMRKSVAAEPMSEKNRQSIESKSGNGSREIKKTLQSPASGAATRSPPERKSSVGADRQPQSGSPPSLSVRDAKPENNAVRPDVTKRVSRPQTSSSLQNSGSIRNTPGLNAPLVRGEGRVNPTASDSRRRTPGSGATDQRSISVPGIRKIESSLPRKIESGPAEIRRPNPRGSMPRHSDSGARNVGSPTPRGDRGSGSRSKR